MSADPPLVGIVASEFHQNASPSGAVRSVLAARQFGESRHRSSRVPAASAPEDGKPVAAATAPTPPRAANALGAPSTVRPATPAATAARAVRRGRELAAAPSAPATNGLRR